MKLAASPMIIPHGTNRLSPASPRNQSDARPQWNRLMLAPGFRNRDRDDSDNGRRCNFAPCVQDNKIITSPNSSVRQCDRESEPGSVSRFIASMILLTGTLLLPGCGQKTYEERIQQSAELYEYLNGVEDALAAPWSRTDIGLSMRLPKPFSSPLPGPTRTKGQDGKMVIGPDTRQENVLRARIPGIVEAWQASIDSVDGQPNAWIYLLSNHDRFLSSDQGIGKPEEFQTDLENELMRVLQVTIPEGVTSKVAENTRYRQWIPAQNSPRAKYTSPKDYTVIRFAPEANSRYADWQVSLYERRAGRVQTALLVITPKNTGPNFRQRLDQALETLEVKEVMPRTRVNAGGGSSAPAPSADF